MEGVPFVVGGVGAFDVLAAGFILLLPSAFADEATWFGRGFVSSLIKISVFVSGFLAFFSLASFEEIPRFGADAELDADREDGAGIGESFLAMFAGGRYFACSHLGSLSGIPRELRALRAPRAKLVRSVSDKLGHSYGRTSSQDSCFKRQIC